MMSRLSIEEEQASRPLSNLNFKFELQNALSLHFPFKESLIKMVSG